MKNEPRIFYSRDEVRSLTEAYKQVFGPIDPELRAYWDLDRKREWGCLTTDFHASTFEQYEEASRRVISIEQTISEPVARGEAMREVTRATGVGLSIGVSPWTDHGLYQTYEQNKHKKELTIILAHDWYPIVPKRATKPHPVDIPLWRYGGLHEVPKYINIGAVPRTIIDKSEMLLFLNLQPDFRPPNSASTGPFKPYNRCAEGFAALVKSVSRRYKVKIISWGNPAWHELSRLVVDAEKAQGVCVRIRSAEAFGRPLALRCDDKIVQYLPLTHPCDRRNFSPNHADHAKKGFREMGYG